MSKIISFAKNWTLPVSIVSGISGYYAYTAIPFLDKTHFFVNEAIGIIQPVLIFAMLFLTFCKIKFSSLRFTRWHFWLVLLQVLSFVVCVWICTLPLPLLYKVTIECFMLCMICPTATAAAVVTFRLGGDSATLTTYTILINLAVALVVPAFIPLLHPSDEYGFVSSFLMIISKVFPLLFCPFLLAVILRQANPKLTEKLAAYRNLPFYLWAVALMLAIAVTMKTIVHTRCSVALVLLISAASAIACIIQFSFGHFVGKHYKEPVSAAQSLGQKNTVFAIWLGYTFLSPITSLAGGFYSIWHNIYNSWQLYRKRP